MNESNPNDVTQDHEGNPIHKDEVRPPAQPLQWIGRYRIEKILGEGGFGVVYLAHDDELKRRVAIKIPLQRRIRSPQDSEAYLVEARILAKLDHPHIVPVYDVGRCEGGLPFVVTKFIEGQSLTELCKNSRVSIRESVSLVARMAEALQYAHQQRLVHRDVKPGNILLDDTNKPFLVDFGLALKEEDFGKGSGISGTPSYMSPEQANGEGHLVDGRSDIYSLGVVLYELLAGQRPFEAKSITQLLSMIASVEPRPLRQVDPAIPKELERITLKALAKRASERYLTSQDFADDLQHWLNPDNTTEKGPTPFKIISKGLRSFDAEDTDFFLELLPGPRDREGLPETLRFWKNRIEENDADKTFRVGMIYGPSGCGKSSFVKAGLLPRLANTVQVVYVEATADDTESRLLKGLRKACPGLPQDSSLRDAITHLRRQGRLRNKVVLIVDQFEQWLHGKHNHENAELLQALRQCDGERVQSIVMVRDDFWLAVSRFMKALEIRAIEGQNAALVDLFDLRHAHKVLMAFGKAYGNLPENGELTKDQESFLEQAVSGLAQEGKVICVRLALFAEMMKGKAWTPASLKAVGGTEGVGVTFLEETFSAATAPPEHRYHQKAARADLKALLPETGSDIKGQMRSYAELMEASGYGSRPKDFDDLLRILDNEVRLITPTDPEGRQDNNESTTQRVAGQKYYQLTHDYLVHSLRDWLTRKQKETRRGRAELLLADRAAVWTARPENRQLPSLLQWFNIRWWTQKKNWTTPQKKMMAKAGQVHAVRGVVIAVMLVLLSWSAYEGHGTLKAHALRDRLLDANTSEVPSIVDDMGSFRRWINPLLYETYGRAEADKDAPKQLHTSLALLPVDANYMDFLYGRLLDAEPHEVPVIRDALDPYKGALLDLLWAVVETPEREKEPQRLRAAAALAIYDPQSEKWAKASGPVVEQLVVENPVFLSIWIKGFRPIKGKLMASLESIYRNANRRESERILAANILVDYAADQPQRLTGLLLDADEKQFAVIYPKFREHGERGLRVLIAEIDKTLPPDLPSSDDKREKLARRQTNAAVALLRLDQSEQFWPLLKHSPDPRVRSYLIHRLSPLGADPQAIVKRLSEEQDITICRALLLSLGEFKEIKFTPDDRMAVLPKLQEMYQTASDPGLHGAAEWLLRQWQQDAWLTQVNDEWAKDKEGREKKIAGIKESITKDTEKPPPQWYVNGQGQTMVVIPGPVEFVMGSPLTEIGRYDYPGQDEGQHKVRISRTFSLAAKPVTVSEFQRFNSEYHTSKYNPKPTCPVIGMSWYSAASYCNSLSRAEGIPEDQWCYVIEGDQVKIRENYLSLTGYRLPTEAEMEYAIRSETTTARFFGETEELLPKYSWIINNCQEKTWPVGTLKPNDFGVFDSMGNVYVWCQEKQNSYRLDRKDEAVEDKEYDLLVNRDDSRVLRGSSWETWPSNTRSAGRYGQLPMTYFLHVGCRPARTLIPSPPDPR